MAEEYRRSFGEEPPKIVAIGLMTDSDDTGNQALAYFDDVRISPSPLEHSASATVPLGETRALTTNE